MHLLAEAAEWPISEASGWVGVLAIVLAWVAREIIPFLRERRKADMDAKTAEEDRIVKAYQEQIADLKAQIKRLDGLLDSTTKRHDGEIKELRAEHLECVRQNAEMGATLKTLQGEVTGLREWRHSVADKQHTDRLTAAENEAEGE